MTQFCVEEAAMLWAAADTARAATQDLSPGELQRIRHQELMRG